MLAAIQTQWRRRLWTPGAVARLPLSPSPCAFCGALGLGSRWQSDFSDGSRDAPPAEMDKALNSILASLKALKPELIPHKSPRSRGGSRPPRKNTRKWTKKRLSLRPPKNRQLLKPVMDYTTPLGQEQNWRSIQRTLTAQVAKEDYRIRKRKPFMPTWSGTLLKLESRTPKRAKWMHHALKLVVPRIYLEPLTQDIDDNIWEITERTTCEIEIYKGVEKDGRLALLLSGDEVALQEATDILADLCDDVSIFRRGLSNSSPPLLPADPFGADNRVAWSNVGSRAHHLLPAMGRPQFWDCRFEEIPYPKVWNKRTFINYIQTLSNAKLRDHRAKELYGSVEEANEALMDLIYLAFKQPVDPGAVSVSAFRIALECMAEKGYNLQPYIRRLFALAQSSLFRLDTSIFNKLLLVCAHMRDLANFNEILDFMHRHRCTPNYSTWVLFFNIVEDEGAKRKVLFAMDEFGFLGGRQVSKDIVLGFAEFDTFRALDSGKSVASLCDEMDRTYGARWPSRGALNKMLLVYGRLERYGEGLELIRFFERQYKIVPNISNFATLLVEVARTGDMRIALEALREIEGRYDLDKTEQIYGLCYTIANKRKFANVMAVVFAYSCLEDATSFPMRFRVSRHLARPGYRLRAKFQWGEKEPGSFCALPGYVPVELWADLNAALEHDPTQQTENMGAVLAGLYRSKLRGFVPSVPMGDMVDKALAIDKRLHALREALLKKNVQGSHVVSIREELAEDEFLEIPVHCRDGREEAKCVKLPITSEALVNNQSEEWFRDRRCHPWMDLLPWQVLLDGQEPQTKVKNVGDLDKEGLAFEKGEPVRKADAMLDGGEPRTRMGDLEDMGDISEEFLAFEKEVSLGETDTTARKEEKASRSQGALGEQGSAEQQEPGLEQEGPWQEGASSGEGTPGASSSPDPACAEPITPADGNTYGEEPSPAPPTTTSPPTSPAPRRRYAPDEPSQPPRWRSARSALWKAELPWITTPQPHWSRTTKKRKTKTK